MSRIIQTVSISLVQYIARGSIFLLGLSPSFSRCIVVCGVEKYPPVAPRFYLAACNARAQLYSVHFGVSPCPSVTSSTAIQRGNLHVMCILFSDYLLLGGGPHFSSIVETSLKAAENHNLWGRRVLSNVPQNGGFL
jgi:hypothetical protein